MNNLYKAKPRPYNYSLDYTGNNLRPKIQQNLIKPSSELEYIKSGAARQTLQNNLMKQRNLSVTNLNTEN